MDLETSNKDTTLATVLHLSVFTKFIVPFGNFIIPLVLWLSRKEDAFIDHHGRNALNFQISIFLYRVLLGLLAVTVLLFFGLSFSDLLVNQSEFSLREFSRFIPFVVFGGIFGILFLALFVLELFAVITASLKASNGELYNYPFSINFIRLNSNNNHQSKNEQFNNTQNEKL